ncbi:MAG: 50S ribosomal protein L28 [Mycoplasmatales bacterium]|nr:50S ribosomal protein L28 [Mycoplasmatales bacterium]
MARKDDITGKRAMSGNYRSHALNSTKRKFNLNLQKVTVIEDGKKKTLKVSAKTAKTLKKQGRVA